MLNKHELQLEKEEMEKVDTMRYVWQKLQAQAAEVSSHLIEIQPQFRTELINDVKLFVVECQGFQEEYKIVKQNFFF